MTRASLAFVLLLVSFAAPAQIQFGTAYSTDGNTCLTPKNLDGATITGKVCVVLTACKPPIDFNLTCGTFTDTSHENTAPCDYKGGEGNLVSFPTGSCTMTAGALTAKFTVTGATPVPPTVPPPTSTKPGEAKLTWAPSATWSDGSTLTTGTGYVINYGLTSAAADHRLELPGANLTGYTITGLEPGVWYFTVQTEAMTAASPPAPVTSLASTPVVSITVGSGTTPPPTCSAAPAVESRQVTCTPPLVGNWTQSHGWTSIAAPACWQADAWLPTQPPVGQCALPSPLLTAGPLSYSLGGTATAPTMTAIGLIAAGLPCGPDTKTVANVKYCRIVRAQTDFVNWPTDLKAVDIWAKSQ